MQRVGSGAGIEMCDQENVPTESDGGEERLSQTVVEPNPSSPGLGERGIAPSVVSLQFAFFVMGWSEAPIVPEARTVSFCTSPVEDSSV